VSPPVHAEPHAIGIDIGGTKIAGGVVTAAGLILDRTRVLTPPANQAATLAALVAVVDGLRARHPLVDAIGIGAAGLVASRAVGTLRFPAGAFSAIGIVLVWFVLGFFFYATLFAVAGSIVPRQEDLQATMTPLTILIIASFFIGISAVQDPSTTLASVASYLPFSAPLVMPTRIVLGDIAPWQALLSAAISIGATFALVPVATRVYSRAVLRTGRVRIREVLRVEG